MCVRRSSVAHAATVDRAGGIACESGERLSNKAMSTGIAFLPGYALSFGSLNYVTDDHGELYICYRAGLEGIAPPTSPPSSVHMQAKLEAVYRRIHLSLGLNPTVGNRRQLFYILANVHHRIVIVDLVYRLDLSHGI